MIKKQLAAFFLILTLVSSAFYLPVLTPTPKAEAIFGVGDIVAVNIKDFVKAIIDGIAQQIAQKMIDEMVKSTINWAQTGFNGNPAFVTNPSQYFGNIANDVAGNYINQRASGVIGQSLCAPIQSRIVISLQQYYSEYYGGGYASQCSFTGIAQNLDDFYNGHFGDAGGWDTWFQVTQNSSNNPYDQFFIQTEGLDRAVQNAVGVKKDELVSASGFLSKTSCKVQNPDQATLDLIRAGENQGYAHAAMEIEYGEYDLGKTAGSCLEEQTITPGSVIKDQLDNVLPSGINKLISVQQIDQLIGAFASGLLNKYVFSSNGLLAGNSANEQNYQLDVDKDTFYDGLDTDGDNVLDSCLHGVKDPNQPAKGDNCVLSSETKNSPYFIPICKDTADTIVAITKYRNFILSNNFASNDSYIWTSRSITVNGAVDNLIETISRYESSDFNKSLSTLGRYTKYMDKEVDSLTSDDKLAKNGRITYTPTDLTPTEQAFYNKLGVSDETNKQGILIRNTAAALDYLKKFQIEVNKNCVAPDTAAISTIDAPDLDSGTEERTVLPSSTATISCSADKTAASIGDTVTWSVNIQPSADIQSYTWSGLGAIPASTPSVPINYNKAGTWTASMTATIVDGNGTPQTSSFLCENQVVVSSKDTTTDTTPN